MRPPYCGICDKELDLNSKDCGLVYFKKRPSDIEWDNKIKEKNMIGHPPYADWFCEKHCKTALQYKHLTIGKAKEKIRLHFQE